MFEALFGWRKASRCKRLIKHVQCRLKLLRNKRESIIRQLGDDAAQLIRDGHAESAESAFSRIEQLSKDQRLRDAYELLYHFCEFVIINLPYIRKHRDLPNDVNEAVSTLIYASARCGDLPDFGMKTGTEEDNKNAISQEHGEASTNAATTPAVVPNQEAAKEFDSSLTKSSPNLMQLSEWHMTVELLVSQLQTLERRDCIFFFFYVAGINKVNQASSLLSFCWI